MLHSHCSFTIVKQALQFLTWFGDIFSLYLHRITEDPKSLPIFLSLLKRALFIIIELGDESLLQILNLVPFRTYSSLFGRILLLQTYYSMKVSSGMLRRVALVRTDVPEEPGAYFIRGTRIGEIGTTQAATSNRRTLRRNTKYLVFLRSVP
jgi:hypothetical protein